MLINGQEIGFALTVGASMQISKMCPGGNIKKLPELLRGVKDDYIKTIEIIGSILKFMNGGFVAGEKLKGKEAARLTDEMIEAMTPEQFEELQSEAMSLFNKHGKGEVDAEKIPEKGKKDATEAE